MLQALVSGFIIGILVGVFFAIIETIWELATRKK